MCKVSAKCCYQLIKINFKYYYIHSLSHPHLLFQKSLIQIHHQDLCLQTSVLLQITDKASAHHRHSHVIEITRIWQQACSAHNSLAS